MDQQSQQTVFETRQSRILFPKALNDHSTLFGGELLKWMDEVAYITAIRYCRQELVTVSADSIQFKKPVPEGTIIELIGSVEKVNNATLVIRVRVFAESFRSDETEIITEGLFKFAAIYAEHNLVRIRVR